MMKMVSYERKRIIKTEKETVFSKTIVQPPNYVKINEHFFTKGEMRVEIVDEGLTKGEARAFERAILNQLRGTNLWNKKDFEPFVEEFDKGYSDKEVSEYFSPENN